MAPPKWNCICYVPKLFGKHSRYPSVSVNNPRSLFGGIEEQLSVKINCGWLRCISLFKQTQSAEFCFMESNVLMMGQKNFMQSGSFGHF